MKGKHTLLIYLSGKCTGIKDFNINKFRVAETKIYKHYLSEPHGTWVCVPHDLPDDHDKSWGMFMRAAIPALCACRKIYVLDDWKHSTGAIVEVLLAKILGMELYEVDTMRMFTVSYFRLFIKLLFRL